MTQCVTSKHLEEPWREKELAVADPDYSEADPHPGLLLHILFLPKNCYVGV